MSLNPQYNKKFGIRKNYISQNVSLEVGKIFIDDHGVRQNPISPKNVPKFEIKKKKTEILTVDQKMLQKLNFHYDQFNQLRESMKNIVFRDSN